VDLSVCTFSGPPQISGVGIIGLELYVYLFSERIVSHSLTLLFLLLSFFDCDNEGTTEARRGAVLDRNGRIVYVPNPNFHSPPVDSFSYKTFDCPYDRNRQSSNMIQNGEFFVFF
jgi:hypothetical protein